MQNFIPRKYKMTFPRRSSEVQLLTCFDTEEAIMTNKIKLRDFAILNYLFGGWSQKFWIIYETKKQLCTLEIFRHVDSPGNAPEAYQCRFANVNKPQYYTTVRLKSHPTTPTPEDCIDCATSNGDIEEREQ